MNRSLFFVWLACCVLVSSAYSQSKAPSTFLATMPRPPTSVSEALRRCPNDVDTLTQQFLREAEELNIAEQKLIARDSVAQIRGDTSGNLSTSERTRIESIRRDLDISTAQLTSRLERITASPSQILLAGVQSIGEELDKEMKNCPKAGEQQILDSACVEMAEARAKQRRIERSGQFLQSVNAEWMLMVQEVKHTMERQEKQINHLLASSKKPQAKYRISRIRNSLWYNVEALLKSTQEIARLATQFSR